MRLAAKLAVLLFARALCVASAQPVQFAPRPRPVGAPDPSPSEAAGKTNGVPGTIAAPAAGGPPGMDGMPVGAPSPSPSEAAPGKPEGLPGATAAPAPGASPGMDGKLPTEAAPAPGEAPGKPGGTPAPGPEEPPPFSPSLMLPGSQALVDVRETSLPTDVLLSDEFVPILLAGELVADSWEDLSFFSTSGEPAVSYDVDGAGYASASFGAYGAYSFKLLSGGTFQAAPGARLAISFKGPVPENIGVELEAEQQGGEKLSTRIPIGRGSGGAPPPSAALGLEGLSGQDGYAVVPLQRFSVRDIAAPLGTDLWTDRWDRVSIVNDSEDDAVIQLRDVGLLYPRGFDAEGPEPSPAPAAAP